jgi:predicted alpha/beta superfamily hydrolase
MNKSNLKHQEVFMNCTKYFIVIVTILFSSFTQAQNSNDVVVGKTTTLNSKVLNEERELFIYLPDNYNYSDSKYPVLYLLDGDAHFLHAAGTVIFLSGNPGLMPPVIIVGIPNAVRTRDFTPTSTDNMPQSGGADNFLKFMREELIPYVNNNYRTEPYRILFGHSATAMVSVYAL